MLDLCCNTGGFSVYAKALGRAEEVTGVDLDEQALELAKNNANLNQSRIRFVQADLFTWLRDILPSGQRFDVVVLDPAKQTRDREEIGFAPKRMARLFRFRHALECLERGVASTTNPPTGLARSPDWTGIAYGCGYSDQSHMIREFHEFAGLAPSAFVRHRLPNEGGLADG